MQCGFREFTNDNVVLTDWMQPALAPQSLSARFMSSGQKAKVKGVIVSRSGDLVKIQDKKSDAVEVVKLGESTRVEREKGLRALFRHTDMDITALVPGPTIEAEGMGGPRGVTRPLSH